MATDVKPAPDTSLTELVTGILHDAQDLIKQQFDLLKVEVLDDLRKTRDAGILMGLGVGVALVGGLLLILMLVYLLNWAVPDLPLWASFGIWGVIACVAGLGLFYAGKQKFASFNPLPNQTAQALKENVKWITNPK